MSLKKVRVVWIVMFLAIVVAALSSSCQFFVTPSPLYEVWFDDLQNGAGTPSVDGESLVRASAESIYQDISTVKGMSVAVQRDVSPRIVFLSVSDGASHAHVAMGTGNGLVQAIEHAIIGIHRDVPHGYRPIWIKLDIVQSVRPIEQVEQDMPLDFERSLEGIAFERGIGLALLPEELVSHTLVNSDQELRPRNISRYSKAQPFQSGLLGIFKKADPVNIYRFTVDSYFYDGKQGVRLYRGHRMFDQLSSDILLEAARSGGDYLTRAVRADGSFTYIYRPKTDEESEKYNILRHAGTVYAMLELYELTGKAEVLQAAEQAIDYLLRSVSYCQTGNEELPCVVEDGHVKLGGNALAAVALAKHIEVTGDERHLPTLIQLGKWIQGLQKESGEFFPHKQTYPDGEATDFESRFYPGEALLALVRIYALEQDESILDTAELGAQYLILVRDGDVPESELNQDHWLLYALNELYRYRPNPQYLRQSLRIARAMVQSQNGGTTYPDWSGGYRQPPTSTSTATRAEGLCAAYQMARDFGDPLEAGVILETIRSAIAFQLQTQFQPESVLYLRDPERALGGFHRSLTNFEIRIDYVQHNISSLLCAHRLLGNNSTFT